MGKSEVQDMAKQKCGDTCVYMREHLLARSVRPWESRSNEDASRTAMDRPAVVKIMSGPLCMGTSLNTRPEVVPLHTAAEAR